MARVKPPQGNSVNWVVRIWWRLVCLFGLHDRLATKFINDFPDVLEPSQVYLIGDSLSPWSAAFLCPCGCGVVIHLSIIKNDRPTWRVKFHFNGTVTFHPSVWRNRGCKSHFFLQHGKPVWIKNNTTTHPVSYSDVISSDDHI